MQELVQRKKKLLTLGLLLIVIPTVVIMGSLIFCDKYYAWISLCVAVLSCIPLFYTFERKENSSKELTVLAVLVALSTVGRFIFAWIPGFKPVTAMIIITAIYLGKESGFVVGSLSAVVSNFYFGQGPWTAFQMFAWGFIGFFTGVIDKQLQKNKIVLCLYGALSGIFYSAVMDVWTTIWTEGTFNLKRYIGATISALPITVEYAVSNVIFLLLLSKPIGDKLERIKKKYGLFLVR